MPNKKELLKYKRIHNLKEEISNEELKLLESGMPIQKIVGFIDFDNLKINVNHEVLIPRYETQEVVHEALNFITKESKILDLCCGSGYIGLTIKQKTNCNVTMTDISKEAILQTKENALLNKLDVNIIQSDLFSNIKDKFDLIISNPPYIPVSNILDNSVLDFEPKLALFAGEDGNEFYKKILLEAKHFLVKGGVLVFEISPDNLEFIKNNNFKIIKDINNKERIAIKVF